MNWPPLITLSVQVTLVSAIALTIAVQLRSAAQRHNVLLAGMMCMLGSPLFYAAGMWTGLSIALPVGFAISPDTVSATPTPIFNGQAQAPRTLAGSHTALPQTAMEVPAVQSTETPLVTAAQQKHDDRQVARLIPLNTDTFISVLWLAGTLLGLIGVLRSYWQTQRILKSSRSLSDQFQMEVASVAATQLKSVSALRIGITGRVAGPAVVGLLQPWILIPARYLETLSRGELLQVLIHEGAHALRRDPLIALLQRICGALFWWHPLVHLVNQQLVRAREDVCDNFVLTQIAPETYGATLLRLATLSPAMARVPLTIGMFGGTGKLEDRIRGLLDTRRKIALRVHVATVVGVLVAFVLFSLFVATIRIQAQTSAVSIQSTRSSPPKGVDFVGDPLPPGAKLRFGTLRFRPPENTHDLALSPDEKTLVTVGEQLIVWDPQTGKELWRAKEGRSKLNYGESGFGSRPIAFSSDSSHFYMPNGSDQISIWNIESHQREVLKIKIGKQKGWGTLSIDVAPEGQTFAMGFPDGIVICNRQGAVRFEIANSVKVPLKESEEDRLTFSGFYSTARFSPNGTKFSVVTSDRPETIRIHDAQTGSELQTIALTAALVRLAFSPDGKQIATTERDNSVRFYDATSGQRLWSHTIQLNNPYENYTLGIAFSPDARTIAVGATDHGIYLLDPATGQVVGRLTGHRWYPWTLAFTADSKMLYSSGWDGAIRRWDVATRKQLSLPQGVHGSAASAASPDGRTVAWQDDSGTIRLVNSQTGEVHRQIHLPGIYFSQLQFSPDGQMLAGGGTSRDQMQVAVWNVQTGDQLKLWSLPHVRNLFSSVESLCFTPDGTRLAAAVSCQSGQLTAAYIWDLPSNQQIARLKHQGLYGLSFSLDGKTLATAGWDSIVRFWETDTGKLRREFHVSTDKNPDPNGLTFAVARRAGEQLDLSQRSGSLEIYAIRYAPQGGLIATAHMNQDVWVWHANNMRPRMRIDVGGSFSYGALSFSPDGLWLATGSSDGTVRLWDPLTGQKVWDRGHHQHHIYTVGFGHDSRTLISGGDDGLSYLWDLRPPEVHAQHGNLPQLWNDLVGEDSAVAYGALWALSDSGDRAVELVAGKLRPVDSLVDPDQFDDGVSSDEYQRRSRMKRILAAEDPKVELTIVARRAISLLAQIGTPAAIQTLEDLAKRAPAGELSQIATDALIRHKRLIR